MDEIFKSWLKRTAHIIDDCSYCQNQRYYVTMPMFGNNYDLTLYACPICNFEDLRRVKKVTAEIMTSLPDFVRMKEKLNRTETL